MMRIVIAMALMLWGGVAQASDTSTGNFFLSHCERSLNNDAPTFFDGVCFGSITGISYLGAALEPKWRFCPPANGSNEQAVRVVVHFLKEHPELLNEDLGLLVIKAFRQAWPCNR